MRIFHLALRSEWEQARQDGSYTTSTLGVSLAEEGFIHASRGDQWQGVRERYYADVTEPLVLLVIDTDLLSSPVVEETPPGASETFPHVYGPITPDAVVQVVPLGDAAVPTRQSFSALYLRELYRNVVISSLVFLVVVAGSLVGRSLDHDWGALTGAVVGLAAGLVAGVALARRWR